MYMSPAVMRVICAPLRAHLWPWAHLSCGLSLARQQLRLGSSMLSSAYIHGQGPGVPIVFSPSPSAWRMGAGKGRMWEKRGCGRLGLDRLVTCQIPSASVTSCVLLPDGNWMHLPESVGPRRQWLLQISLVARTNSKAGETLVRWRALGGPRSPSPPHLEAINSSF